MTKSGARIQAIAAFRRTRLLVLAREARESSVVDGYAIEVGVFRGESALTIRGALPDVPFVVVESFQGLRDLGPEDLIRSDPRARGHAPGDFAIRGSRERNRVRRRLAEADIELFEGLLTTALPLLADYQFRFCHVDVDTYESTRTTLEFLIPRLQVGGRIILDDVDWPATPGVRRALSHVQQSMTLCVSQVSLYQARITQEVLCY